MSILFLFGQLLFVTYAYIYIYIYIYDMEYNLEFDSLLIIIYFEYRLLFYKNYSCNILVINLNKWDLVEKTKLNLFFFANGLSKPQSIISNEKYELLGQCKMYLFKIVKHCSASLREDFLRLPVTRSLLDHMKRWYLLKKRRKTILHFNPRNVN